MSGMRIRIAFSFEEAIESLVTTVSRTVFAI